MRRLRWAINITLDGCYDHRVGIPDPELHLRATALVASADALLFGRVNYQMMEAAWRLATRTVQTPDWMEPFARTMDAAKKYVVSSTLDHVDWNAELVRGDLRTAVQQLKAQPGKELLVIGPKLAFGLAELGLIDEYAFTLHPRIVGHGPTLFAGLAKIVDLTLVDCSQHASGAVELKYVPKT